MCELLMANGASVDNANRKLDSPAQEAARFGHLEAVKVLFKTARVGRVTALAAFYGTFKPLEAKRMSPNACAVLCCAVLCVRVCV